MNKDDPNIIDLRNMPLFFEDITEESFIPLYGPKRIDGLSKPMPNEDEPSNLRKLPFIGLIVLLILLIGAGGSALALRKPKVVSRTNVSVATTKLASTPTVAAAKVEEQVAYVNHDGALAVHSSPEFTSTNLIGSVPYGSAVKVIEQVDSIWTKVSYNGQVGYMSRYYLTFKP